MGRGIPWIFCFAEDAELKRFQEGRQTGREGVLDLIFDQNDGKSINFGNIFLSDFVQIHREGRDI